jgi:hypothetical protein
MLHEKLTSGTADRIVHLMTTYLVVILTKRMFLFDMNWLNLYLETIQNISHQDYT